MTQLSIFVDRLAKIGINVTFKGNYPWIYLNTVNDIKVQGKYLANHGFTAFWYGNKEKGIHISDISEVFKKIRETLNSKK